MFTLSLNKIKGYDTCPDGPAIFRWFDEKYDRDEEIPIMELFKQWGPIHTFFCLRAVDGGPEFCAKLTDQCVERMISKYFSDSDMINRYYWACNLMLTNLKKVDKAYCRQIAHEIEKEIAPTFKNKKQRLAALSVARFACGLYTLNGSGPTSVGYFMGAAEDAMNAADDPIEEGIWQENLLRTKLQENMNEE